MIFWYFCKIFVPGSEGPPLNSSKLYKKNAVYGFNFDLNGITFSKRVENTVGKIEIALDEQFLLFPQCFQKTCTEKHVKSRACVEKG